MVPTRIERLTTCALYARRHPHPEFKDRTVWEAFEEERPSLVAYRGPFDGFHATPVSVSKTCVVRFDGNRYSVAARAVGRPVEVHAYAERIVISQDGEIVDPWRYVPVLARKPGASLTFTTSIREGTFTVFCRICTRRSCILMSF